MSAIEWALLELLLSTDPAGRLSALVVVTTVLVAFALAAVVIASAARSAVRSAIAPTVSPESDCRIPASPPEPPGAVIRTPLTGRPAPRAPGASPRRPFRTA